MLPVNIDNLSAYLKPPLGYRFDRGFTTTYSLHLDILLTIPMFLDGRLSEENAVIQNYQGVVMVINNFKDKFKVYAQKGEIQTSSLSSKKASRLYEFLRPMIEEISKDTTKLSFHPKLWLLRYESENGKDKRYRLIILSKNLTNSKDLDIAVVFDGKVSKDSQHKNINSNLWYFCNTILDNKDFSKNELESISWDNVDGYSLENIYILPKDSKKLPFIENIKMKEKMKEKMVVFSPFITNDLFAKDTTLITREEEIKGDECDNIFMINSSLIEEEEQEEKLDMFEEDKNSNDKIFINQLHAKIYIYTHNRKNWLTFGSANATNRGLNKNNEVLVELKAPKKFYENIKKYIETNKFFEKYVNNELEEEVEEDNELIDDVLDEVLDIDKCKREVLQGKITVKYDGAFLILKTKLKAIQSDVKIEVTPSSKVSFKDYKPELKWKVSKSEITGLFTFKLTKDGESREFLLNDREFKSDVDYIKAIKEEASKKSQDYLKSNIFALLNDGNITKLKMEKILKQEVDDDMHNHCSKTTFTSEYIYDLMLDKYSINTKEYNAILELFKKVDEYKPLTKILPKAKV